MEKTKITSLASLSAAVAWSLLKPEEQHLLLVYIEKVREWDANKKIQEKQEKARMITRSGLCAMSRMTVSLVEPGGIKRNIPGSSNPPGVERQRGK